MLSVCDKAPKLTGLPNLDIRESFDSLLSLEGLVLDAGLVLTDTLDHECLVFISVTLNANN